MLCKPLEDKRTISPLCAFEMLQCVSALQGRDCLHPLTICSDAFDARVLLLKYGLKRAPARLAIIGCNRCRAASA